MVATEAVSGRIVRNLTKVNGFLCLPTRVCRKTGDPVSKKPITVSNNKTGRPKTSPSRENRISKKRIINLRIAEKNLKIHKWKNLTTDYQDVHG
jgi:hypothetical protein